MADGKTKPIDMIQVGDLVLATDPETGETATEEVTNLILGSGLKELVRVGSDPDGDGVTDWITATDGHPFWVRRRGWTDADDLKLGDQFVSDKHTTLQVTMLSRSIRVAVVHNITVNRIHTYYVKTGDQSVLVHNGSCPVHGHDQQKQSKGQSRKGPHQKAGGRKAREQAKSNNPNRRNRPVCNGQTRRCNR